MSNFTFLNNDWPDLYATAREAEQNVNSAPRTSCFYARRSLERTVKWLYANDSYLKQPYADNLAALGFDFAQPPVPERSRREPCLFPQDPHHPDDIHDEGLDGVFGDAGATKVIHLIEVINLKAAV